RFNMAKPMRAMVLDKPAQWLQLRDVAKPKPARGQLLVRISTCAVCRTDLHVVDGELPNPKLPLILGHQIVGRVEEVGEPANFKSEISNQKFATGDRVGIPWLGWTDGECAYCQSNRENLCDNARFTGYTIDGGYAEFTVADARFCFHLPDLYDDVAVAPLLCAGLIGYRSYRKTGNSRRPGLYGFGNAANLIRCDGEEFFEIAPRVPVKTKTETFPMEQANTALEKFRAGKLKGTAVLMIAEGRSPLIALSQHALRPARDRPPVAQPCREADVRRTAQPR